MLSLPSKKNVILFWDCAQDCGGAQISFGEVISYLNTSDMSYSVVLGGGPGIWRWLKDEGITVVGEEGPGTVLRWGIGQNWKFITKTLPWLRRLILKVRPQIVCANGWISALSVAFVLKTLPKVKIPWLWYERDYYFPPVIVRWLVQQSQATIVLSKFVYYRLQHLLSEKDIQQCYQIYHGCDVGRIQKLGKQELAKEVKQWLQGRPYLLSAGAIIPWKRHELLIRVLHQLLGLDESWCGIILGGKRLYGSEPYQAYLQHLAKKLKVDDRIWWAGYHENPYPFLANATLMCHCAKNEPFGRVVAESLILGTPVMVLSDSGGPLEVIEGVQGAFVSRPIVGDMVKMIMEKKVKEKKQVLLDQQWYQQFSLQRHVESLGLLLNQLTKET